MGTDLVQSVHGGGCLKKRGLALLAVLLILCTVLPTTEAITSQGFFYRVEDGDRLYYSFEVMEQGEPGIDEIIYIEVENSSKVIPDPVTQLSEFDYLDVGVSYANGTSIGLLALLFIYLPHLEYPVGNWELIDSLAVSDLEYILPPDAHDISLSLTELYWGLSYTTNDSDTQTDIWADYHRFDGFFFRYHVEHWNTTTSEIISEFTMDRLTENAMAWGFEDGARFDFHLVMDASDFGYSDQDELFYLKVNDDGLFYIPYSMDEWDDIPFLLGNLFWANDTIFYDPILSHSRRLAVPIGNWTLLDTFIETLGSTETITLEAPNNRFWGYSWNETIGDVLLEVHTDYLKEDGFLSHHTVTLTNTTSSVVGSIVIERTGIEQYDDAIAPTINHPADLEFIVGTEGLNITWTPADDYPLNYFIMVNGTAEYSGTWSSGTPIVLSLDGFDVGVYNCSIIVYDFAGNHVVDFVFVTVLAENIPATPLPEILLYIAVAAGVVVFLGAIYIVKRR
jgi:hypothetical protein